MAASAQITLDLTAPSASVSIDGGASVSSDLDVDLTITCADSDKNQMKVYGDVDDAFATSEYRASEANAPWISFSGTKTIRLSSGDAVKTVRIKVRDDVNNASTEATDTITVDTTIPVITITSGPDNSKISKQSTKDTSTLIFQSDIALDQWEVRIVTNANDSHTAGSVIPETGGSDTQGAALAATTPQTVTIKGVDMESAGASGSGSGGTQHRIKVFGRSANNAVWSVGSS